MTYQFISFTCPSRLNFRNRPHKLDGTLPTFLPAVSLTSWSHFLGSHGFLDLGYAIAECSSGGISSKSGTLTSIHWVSIWGIVSSSSTISCTSRWAPTFVLWIPVITEWRTISAILLKKLVSNWKRKLSVHFSKTWSVGITLHLYYGAQKRFLYYRVPWNS